LSDQVVAGGVGWDQGMFSVIGAVCAAGKILGLSQEQMRHAIALAVVPNLPLGVTRVGELSMWKGCATASATRAAIFAAHLAQQGMSGPAEPFEGRRGLWEQAVGKPVTLEKFGGNGEPFRITATTFKFFPSQIHTQGPIGLALELRSQVAVSDIAALRLHGYRAAVSSAATEPEKWDPQTRETADHSIPYLVELFLNKREPSSTVQHRPQWHHPQSALCGCGSYAPKCCSASYHQSHARQRCGFGSRLYLPPFARRLMLLAGSSDSYAASYKECQAEQDGNPIAY